MLEWTVEEKVLLNSRQVIVDGWRMNNQQLCQYMEKLLNNQDKVLPGRLGKGFLDIMGQIAAGKTKVRWSDMMKDIEKMQEIIQGGLTWEEEGWFEYLQEMEVQQDRYFKTPLGTFFLETLKFKLNLMEDPEEKAAPMEEDQEILPPFLREEVPEISPSMENDLPEQDKQSADSDKTSKKTYFRRKSAKSASKKTYFKKKAEPSASEYPQADAGQELEKGIQESDRVTVSEADFAPEMADWDPFDEKAMADIMEWDPFRSNTDRKERAGRDSGQSVPDKGKNTTGSHKEKTGTALGQTIAETDRWNAIEEINAEMDGWELFAGQPEMDKMNKMDNWDPFQDQKAVSKTDRLHQMEGERTSSEDGWDLFGEQSEMTGLSDWDSFEGQSGMTGLGDWDSFGGQSEMTGLSDWDSFKAQQTVPDTAGREFLDNLSEVQKKAEWNQSEKKQPEHAAASEETGGAENADFGSARSEKGSAGIFGSKEITTSKTNNKRKLNNNDKQQMSLSKILKRTAIAVFACLSLCIAVLWLRDQIARNIDKWNISQMKIGSFGRAGEERLQYDAELLSDSGTDRI